MVAFRASKARLTRLLFFHCRYRGPLALNILCRSMPQSQSQFLSESSQRPLSSCLRLLSFQKLKETGARPRVMECLSAYRRQLLVCPTFGPGPQGPASVRFLSGLRDGRRWLRAPHAGSLPCWFPDRKRRDRCAVCRLRRLSFRSAVPPALAAPASLASSQSCLAHSQLIPCPLNARRQVGRALWQSPESVAS